MADFGSVLTKRKLDQIQDETQFLFNKKIKADKNTCIDVWYIAIIILNDINFR